MKKIPNIKQALQIFCYDGNDQFHDKYRRPFLNGADGDIVATETHILISVDPALTDEEFEQDTQRMPKYELDNNDTRVIPLSDIEAAFEQIKKVPAQVKKYDDCPECAGSGLVEWMYEDMQGETHYMMLDCPVCDGSGRTEITEEATDGELILPEHAVVFIDGVFFSVRLWKRVIEAARLMGYSNIIWKKNHSSRVNVFDLDEGVRVLFMPCLHDGPDEEVGVVNIK